MLGGKLMFPSDYVAAVEFRGKDVTLTVAGVQMEGLMRQGARQKEFKPILLFKETKKKLVLNKTNAGIIADLYGTNAESWVGHRVTFYPTTTQCGRNTVDCIRVRDHRPTGETPLPPPEVLADPAPHEEVQEADDFQQLVGEEAGPQLPPASSGPSRKPEAARKSDGAGGTLPASGTGSTATSEAPSEMTEDEKYRARMAEAQQAGK
jgi:hypothetical protein